MSVRCACLMANAELACLVLQILAKAEMLNPGGSVKDRVALQVVQEALAEGRLRPGGLITEGTAGWPTIFSVPQCCTERYPAKPFWRLQGSHRRCHSQAV